MPILGETNFQPWVFTRSGSKAKYSKEKEREREERPKVGNNNGQLRIATPPRVAHASQMGQKLPYRRLDEIETLIASYFTRLPGAGSKQFS